METVYWPAEDSFLMREALEECLSSALSHRSAEGCRLKTQGSRPKTAYREPFTVLDMGTGSGILAIAAAKKGCKVTAADINPDAVEAARKNAKGLKIDFVHSDLFEKIRGKYDLIVFNPPYVPCEKTEKIDMQSIAWHGGPDGFRVISRFMSSAGQFLKPGGRILLLATGDKAPQFPGFVSRVLAEKRLFFERLTVLELAKSRRKYSNSAH